jgi:hypothetical protein
MAAVLSISKGFPIQSDQAINVVSRTFQIHNELFPTHIPIITSTYPSATILIPPCIGTGLRAGRFRAQLRHKQQISLSSKKFRQCLDTIQPPIQRVTVVLYLEIKQTQRETEHSPQLTAEVKNEWSYNSTPLIFLQGVNRGNFASTFYPSTYYPY